LPRVPRISGDQAVRAFEKDGWRVDRQSGSHIVMLKPGSILSLSIPRHRELGPGLLSDQIKKAGLTLDEFLKLL
jgi:predicted RNA binding protein YcfA (HicA-like mRNA interferase family)